MTSLLYSVNFRPMETLLTKFSIPNNQAELFADSLYHFICLVEKHPDKPANRIITDEIQYFDSLLENELKDISRSAIEKQVQAMNQWYNTRKLMHYLSKHWSDFNSLLTKLVEDPTLMQDTKQQLEKYLFEEEGTEKSNLLASGIDTLARMLGARFGTTGK